MDNTAPDFDDKHSLEERRICVFPTLNMKKKASAYYILCYRKFLVHKRLKTNRYIKIVRILTGMLKCCGYAVITSSAAVLIYPAQKILGCSTLSIP